MSLPPYQSEGVIRSPCVRCDYMKFEIPEVVKLHLYRKAFIENYFVWTNHGEINGSRGIFHNMVVGESSRSVENTNRDSRIHDMVTDAFGMHFGGEPNENVEQTPIDDVKCFYEQLEEASRPLRKGSPHSQLSVAVRLLSIKSNWNISQATMDSFIDLMSELVDPNIKLPGDFYKAKRLVSNLGLLSMRIDCCEDGCMLYYKDDATLNSCKFCKKSSFKRLSSGNMVAIKAMHYLPLIPTLKRLYASMSSTPHMRWNFENRRPLDVMCHPSDGEAWKHFDRTYLDFASELSNIQLGKEIWERVQNFSKVTEAPPYKFLGYGVTHNWTKQSIFWELPYWKDNLLHHSVNVMHIEKNYFDNLFNTVMDVKGQLANANNLLSRGIRLKDLYAKLILQRKLLIFVLIILRVTCHVLGIVPICTLSNV
ncbi:uncharacterized protein [Nicotiana sylvestris]|uniref:uncharacterized protein n=1 Tax=Nicotiana sylvestris TaxID=4096 RepID=UPI00388CE5B0